MNLKRKLLLLIFLISTISLQTFPQSNPKNILGDWISTEDDRQISIYLGSDNLYYGKTINKTGEEVPVGKILLKKLLFDKEEQCFIGILTPPDNDSELDVQVYLENDNSLKLVAKKFIFSKTIYFKRLK